MLTVLTLGLIERIINGVLSTDPIAHTHLQTLSGKTLRVVVNAPSLSVDVLFCDDHIRFEPVSQSIFEPQGGVVVTPDCTLTVDTPAELLALMRHPSGNLPIKGDYKVLMQIKAMSDDFSPDIFDKLENLIGKNASSYAYLALQELSPIVAPVLSSVKSMFYNPASHADSDALDALISQKKQELLRLQSDIEREQARLNALQNQPSSENHADFS